MTFPFEIDVSRRRALVWGSATVVAADIAATIEALYHHPDWQPGFDTIWSGTETTEFLFDFEDHFHLLNLQERLAKLAGFGRDVLVMRRPIDSAVCKTYQLISRGGPREVYVVQSMTDALFILEQPRCQKGDSDKREVVPLTERDFIGAAT